MLPLLALLACHGPDKASDSTSPVDTAEPPDPIPRREGELSLAASDARIDGNPGDVLGTAAVGGGESWLIAVGVPQRNDGVGGVLLFDAAPGGAVPADSAAAQVPGGTLQGFSGATLARLDDALAVGAFWDGSGGAMAGAVALWDTPTAAERPDALWMGDAGDNAGVSVQSVGDWTGDGVEDLAVGAIGVDGGEAEAGRVSVLDGSLRGERRIADAEVAIWGTEHGGYVGVSVCPGDLDGDGAPDLVVGALADSGDAASSGVAWVYYGPLRQSVDTRDADGALFGEESFGQTGKSVSCGGDVDGDGLPDIAIGAPETGDGGFVYVHNVSPLGPVGVRDGALAVISAEAPGDRAGFSVAIVPDRDLDGQDELLIGAPRNSAVAEFAGAAYLFYGPPEGVPSVLDAPWILRGEAEEARAGAVVGQAGDFDGDHAPELFVGANGVNSGAGTLYLLY